MKIGPVRLFERRVVGHVENPLLIRWVLFRLPPFGVFLHHMLRDDHDRALHDHPWPFVSWVLSGGYFERHNQTIDGTETMEWRAPGSVLVRPAEWRHRFCLEPGVKSWTLVLVGRRSRKWGFWPSTGWCWWRKYNYRLNICEEKILYPEGED